MTGSCVFWCPLNRYFCRFLVPCVIVATPVCVVMFVPAADATSDFCHSFNATAKLGVTASCLPVVASVVAVDAANRSALSYSNTIIVQAPQSSVGDVQLTLAAQTIVDGAVFALPGVTANVSWTEVASPCARPAYFEYKVLATTASGDVSTLSFGTVVTGQVRGVVSHRVAWSWIVHIRSGSCREASRHCRDM